MEMSFSEENSVTDQELSKICRISGGIVQICVVWTPRGYEVRFVLKGGAEPLFLVTGSNRKEPRAFMRLIGAVGHIQKHYKGEYEIRLDLGAYDGKAPLN
ncbi:MAG: hypothetical protein LBG69_09820 [Zoogloeaceae bacterium]|jgi:hypothetical protein|nr:hypothetical protein [Zoogloeaceae bacterium]